MKRDAILNVVNMGQGAPERHHETFVLDIQILWEVGWF